MSTARYISVLSNPRNEQTYKLVLGKSNETHLSLNASREIHLSCYLDNVGIMQLGTAYQFSYQEVLFSLLQRIPDSSEQCGYKIENEFLSIKFKALSIADQFRTEFAKQTLQGLKNCLDLIDSSDAKCPVSIKYFLNKYIAENQSAKLDALLEKTPKNSYSYIEPINFISRFPSGVEWTLRYNSRPNETNPLVHRDASIYYKDAGTFNNQESLGISFENAEQVATFETCLRKGGKDSITTAVDILKKLPHERCSFPIISLLENYLAQLKRSEKPTNASADHNLAKNPSHLRIL